MISELINKLSTEYTDYRVSGGIAMSDEDMKKSLTTSNKMILVNHVSNQVNGYFTDSNFKDFHVIEIIIKKDGDILLTIEDIKSKMNNYTFVWGSKNWRLYFSGGVAMSASKYEEREIKTYATMWTLV